MDDGESGEFVTIYKSQQVTTYTVSEGIERGKYFRFRYRVQNVIGYSEYSDVAYIQAVASPSAPSPPEFVSATDETITINIMMSTDSNGVDVETYELWMDTGDDLTSSFSQITAYDGLSSAYTMVSADGLGSPGTLYRLKVRALNEDVIYSDFSEVLVVALGSVPSAPSMPVKKVESSGSGKIALEWDPLTGGTLPIYGYRLYCDMGTDDEF